MEVTHAQFDKLREDLNAKIDAKVGYNHFYWVIGTMVGVISSILIFQIGLIMRLDDRVEKVGDKTATISEDLSEINGNLNRWELRK